MSHLIFILPLALWLPLLPQQLLEALLERGQEVMKDVVALLLPLLIVFFMTLGLMDVMVKQPVLQLVVLVVLVVAAPQRKRLVIRCRAHAGDSWCVPLAIGSAANGGGVSLDEALFTVITDQGVDLIARLHDAKHSSILHHRRLPTCHCSLFAGEGQVVVAGHIIPLPPLMPNHHHTVLS